MPCCCFCFCCNLPSLSLPPEPILLPLLIGVSPSVFRGSCCRGWRATAAGARGDSQLLSLAPAVLQDMAVTAADAVAAAYLADAAAAGPADVTAAAAVQQQQKQQQLDLGRSSLTSSGSSGNGGLQGALALAGAAAQQDRSGVGRGSAGSSDGGGGGGSLEAGWWPTFVHAQLGSTRQLQRFTNAVALNRWVQVCVWVWDAATRCAIWQGLL